MIWILIALVISGCGEFGGKPILSQKCDCTYVLKPTTIKGPFIVDHATCSCEDGMILTKCTDGRVK